MREICCFYWKLIYYHKGNIILLNLTKSRNSDASVVYGTNSNWDFVLLWICTKVILFFKRNFGEILATNRYISYAEKDHTFVRLFFYLQFIFSMIHKFVGEPTNRCHPIIWYMLLYLLQSVLQRVPQCALQYIVMCCAPSLDFMLLCVLQSVLQCVLHCVLQCIAVCCTP